MHLTIVQFLLLSLAFLLCLYDCRVKADMLPAAEEQTVILYDDVENSTFESQPPNIPFTGPIPLTTERLIELVQKDYADRIPLEVHVRQIMENIIGTIYEWDRYITLSWIFYVDIRVPWMTTCKPVIRDVTHLAQGIVCPNQTVTGCSQSTTFRVVETYQSTEFLRIETTFSVGAGYGGVDASISTTREQYWEQVWGRTDETEVTYRFDLEPGARCIPSMAHVELECDVNYDTVWYDSYFRRPRDFTDLEYRWNRKGGPFRDNQWCFTQRVSNTPLQNNNNWSPVLENDGGSRAGGSRGDIWKRPASEMNNFRLSPLGRQITDQDMVVRRARGSGGDLQELFVCQRNPSYGRREKIVVPLASQAGALQGYIGCVSV